MGSPPRVRGTVASAGSESSNLRITPACAGNRPSSSTATTIPWDHPRVCGEQGGFPTPVGLKLGSPPRVRGTVSPPAIFLNFFRITPACAGNSSDYFGITCRKRDHPRVCGEQIKRWYKSAKIKGSPPRVRGTGASRKWGLIIHRITPACAGNRQKEMSIC